MNRWIFRIYNALVVVLMPFVLLFVFIHWRRRVLSKGLHRWDERWGRLTPQKLNVLGAGRWWWVHAVSVGETKAIEPLLREAPRRNIRIFLSLVTPEALAWAQTQKLAEVIVAAPIDLPWVIRRLTRVFKPEWFISVESEFWPNLLRETKRSGARVALVNGRISAHSFRSYGRALRILPALWECLDVWAVREEEDAKRFRLLGVPAEKIQVTGNMKYDLPLPPIIDAPHDPKTPVVVMGSTREGEEEMLLPVMARLRQKWPTLRVIWAPRHVERAAEVGKFLTQAGVSHRVRSQMTGAGSASGEGATDIVWDVMGNLLDAYALADVVVIGGSFVSKGGQNPLEPAALKKAMVFGLSMENFRGIADALVQDKGAYQVPLEQVESCLARLFSDPVERRRLGEQAFCVLKQRQGATARTLALLEDFS